MEERDIMIEKIEIMEDKMKPIVKKNEVKEKIKVDTSSQIIDKKEEPLSDDKKKSGFVSGFASFFLTERDFNK